MQDWLYLILYDITTVPANFNGFFNFYVKFDIYIISYKTIYLIITHESTMNQQKELKMCEKALFTSNFKISSTKKEQQPTGHCSKKDI